MAHITFQELLINNGLFFFSSHKWEKLLASDVLPKRDELNEGLYQIPKEFPI